MSHTASLALLLALSGCATFGTPWYYEGPDVSRETVGPIIVSAEQMNNACSICRDEPRGCYGCMVPAHNAIYLRVDATRNHLNLCRLPDREPETTEEHEWCHARGWRH